MMFSVIGILPISSKMASHYIDSFNAQFTIRYMEDSLFHRLVNFKVPTFVHLEDSKVQSILSGSLSDHILEKVEESLNNKFLR